MTIYTTRDEAGITSACAEKSIPTLPPISLHRNYLRMRGEELLLDPDGETTEELPPHARRRAFPHCRPLAYTGITSACAEKSFCSIPTVRQPRNYLRMRGEERGRKNHYRASLELPPHARRRDGFLSSVLMAKGITSACAEKSGHRCQWWRPDWNYLRMRGEERRVIQLCDLEQELPPHARRRGACPPVQILRRGITSACAEKSGLPRGGHSNGRNYLRMRGEETVAPTRRISSRELPPHARRRARRSFSCHCSRGITSACAEKSHSNQPGYTPVGNYLRMRGEEHLLTCQAWSLWELPPHARRRATRINPDTHP